MFKFYCSALLPSFPVPSISRPEQLTTNISSLEYESSGSEDLTIELYPATSQTHRSEKKLMQELIDPFLAQISAAYDPLLPMLEMVAHTSSPTPSVKSRQQYLKRSQQLPQSKSNPEHKINLSTAETTVFSRESTPSLRHLGWRLP
jgi:hypothetical protein